MWQRNVEEWVRPYDKSNSIYQMRVFTANEERPELSNFIVGIKHEILVKDDEGEAMRLVFRVTRNAQLGYYQPWICGQVLEPLSGCTAWKRQ